MLFYLKIRRPFLEGIFCFVDIDYSSYIFGQDRIDIFIPIIFIFSHT